MVVLDLKEIFQQYDVYEKHYSLKPEDLSIPSDVGDLKKPVEVYLRIEKDSKGYRVHMVLQGEVELECSRCLNVFVKDISQDSEKIVGRYPKGENLSLSEEDLNFSFMEEPDTVILEDLVREEIILSVPMKPLCSPDCRGVDHPALILEEDKPTDPRFAILKNLLHR